MGGYSNTSSLYKNDIWSSNDGINWTEESSAAGWSGRERAGNLVFNNKIWIVGGYTGSYVNDIWYSSDGRTFIEETSSSSWQPCMIFALHDFSNNMWILGGKIGASNWLNNVWKTDIPLPSANIKANLSDNPTITYNTAANLTWTSTNTDSCVASDAWDGVKSASSSSGESTGDLTTTKTYTITCTGAGGSASDSVVVKTSEATALPTVNIKASGSDGPVILSSGSSASISWDSTGATSCAASGDWSGGKAVSGAESLVNLTQSKKYTIVCTGAGGTATDSVEITISSGEINGIAEGSLIRATGDIDVYIVKYKNGKRFKRLILSPSVFNSYQHLSWGNIKEYDNATVNLFTTSELVRAAGDSKVYKLYPAGDTGQKRWVTTSEAFVRMDFDWDAVYEINNTDRDSYLTGAIIE